MSFSGALQGYGEKPMTATRTPCTLTIVTLLGSPAYATPTLLSACCVCRKPRVRKSLLWLFATFTRSMPDHASALANDGGAWKA